MAIDLNPKRETTIASTNPDQGLTSIGSSQLITVTPPTSEADQELIKKLSKSQRLDYKALETLIKEQGARGPDVIANAQAHIYNNTVAQIPLEARATLEFSEIFGPMNHSKIGVSWSPWSTEIQPFIIAAALRPGVQNPQLVDQNLTDLCDYLSRNYLPRKESNYLPDELRKALKEREHLQIQPEFCLRANIRPISAAALKEIGIEKLTEIAREVTKSERIGISPRCLAASIHNLSRNDKYEFLTTLLKDPTNLKSLSISLLGGGSRDVAEPLLELLWKSFTGISRMSRELFNNPINKRVAELSKEILKLDEPHSYIVDLRTIPREVFANMIAEQPHLATKTLYHRLNRRLQTNDPILQDLARTRLLELRTPIPRVVFYPGDAAIDWRHVGKLELKDQDRSRFLQEAKELLKEVQSYDGESRGYNVIRFQTLFTILGNCLGLEDPEYRDLFSQALENPGVQAMIANEELLLMDLVAQWDPQLFRQLAEESLAKFPVLEKQLYKIGNTEYMASLSQALTNPDIQKAIRLQDWSSLPVNIRQHQEFYMFQYIAKNALSNQQKAKQMLLSC